MNQMKTLFVISLLFISACIPCVAAAGNNEELSAYDVQANKTIEQVPAANAMGTAAGAQVRRADIDELQRAREIYRNDKTPENQQKLIDSEKKHLLNMLDLMTGRIKLLQKRIEIAEKNNTLVPEGASDKLARYELRLESYKPEVRSADTLEDFRSVTRSIKAEWRLIRKEILHYAKFMIAVRIEMYIEKSGDISDRLDEKATELEGEGVDTTNLRQNLDAFDEKLVCVEENYELAKDAVSDDEVNPGEVQQYIRNASRCIREANNILRVMFKELRAREGYMDGAVILNGTGTLEASGSGTAWVHGSLDLALSCDHGTLLVRDHVGDMNITVTGNGGSDQTGRWTMCHGFDGTADITGSDVSVALVGSGIDLTVTGTGRAILVGDGIYQVSGSDGDMISSGDWQELRDEYALGIDEIVSEGDESTGDESADESEDEEAANEAVNETVNESADDPANESDSGTDEIGDGDTDASGNETESGTDDSEVES